MSTLIRDAFYVIGAEAFVETAGNVFEIDVRQNGRREAYHLKYPTGDTVLVEALDVKPKQRHLIMDVTGWRLPISGRYLCGHDEQHWFVASLPFDRRTATVRGAMEALKPAIVLREQKREAPSTASEDGRIRASRRVVLPATTEHARRRIGCPKRSVGSRWRQATSCRVVVPSCRSGRDVC